MTRLNVYAGPAGDKAMPDSRTLCALMLSLVLLLVGTGSVFALPLQDRPTRLGPAALQAEPGWEQVNSNGFGDLDAGEVTALAVFNNYLYAGTHNAADGALILRSPDGVSWTAVIEPGFGIPHDTAPPAILDLTVYGTYLYASTGRGQDPAKIWRTSNGLYWLPVVNSGFSGADTVDISALAGYGGMLYAGTADRIGGAQIWRSYTGDSNSWTQDSPASLVGGPAGVTGFAVFGGALYATVESDGPAQIWRTYGGSSGWAPVMSDGFGSHLTTLTGGMAVFGDYLYAGAGNSAVGAQLWRSLDGESWVPAATPGAAGGNNEAVESLFVFGSQLYASLRNAATGIEVWHSADGATWEQSNLDGFGDSDNAGTNRGNATTAFLSRLFVGTANTLEGGELWRLTPASPPSYGLALSPGSSTAAGLPGTTVVHTLTISNTGTAADTYHLALTSYTWATNLPVSSLSLPAGASGQFSVTVSIPPGAPANATDVALVTATSAGDPAVSASVAVTTRCLGSTLKVYLPALLRLP